MKSPHSIEFLRQGPTLDTLQDLPEGSALVCVNEMHRHHPLTNGQIVKLVTLRGKSADKGLPFVVIDDDRDAGGFYQHRFVPYREGATEDELLAWWKWLKLTHSKDT